MKSRSRFSTLWRAPEIDEAGRTRINMYKHNLCLFLHLRLNRLSHLDKKRSSKNHDLFGSTRLCEPYRVLNTLDPRSSCKPLNFKNSESSVKPTFPELPHKSATLNTCCHKRLIELQIFITMLSVPFTCYSRSTRSSPMLTHREPKFCLLFSGEIAQARQVPAA